MKKILFFISIFLGFISCNESNNNEGKSIDNPVKEIIVENPKFNQLESTELLTTESVNDSIITNNVRKHLYFELRNFDNEIVFMQTNKFKILLDYLSDGSIRYASWSKDKNISEKPDLILKNGILKYDGTGGNHSYIFKNYNYIYECVINVIVPDSYPDAFLDIYKGDENISRQRAEFISLSDDNSIDSLKQKITLTFSNWYEIIEALKVNYPYIEIWSEIGVRGKYKIFSKYLSKDILEDIIGEKIFLSGPHLNDMNFDSYDKFGYYNPIFLKKLHKKIKLLISNDAFIKSTQDIYNEKFKNTLRVYFLSLNMLDHINYKTFGKYDWDRYVEEYLDVISKPPSNYMVSNYFDENFRSFAESIKNEGYNFSEGLTFPGFWIRRKIDGTDEEFFELINLILNKYDSEWYDSYP